MTENIFMEVSDTDVIGNSDVRGGKTFEIQAIVEIENKPPLQQKSTGASAQSELPSDEGDELEKLYESRKTAVSQPEESPPQPADVSCRPPAPLYVRRVGLRFWCTKRILDWQRQAMRAREDPEAFLKPVQEYGEESASKNSEIGEVSVKGDNLACLNAGCLPADQNITKMAARTCTNRTLRKMKGDVTSKLGLTDLSTHTNMEFQKTYGHRKRPIGPGEHYENQKDHENDREHAHYENDKEQGHYENDGEHGHYESEGEHGHYENEGEHGHYENEGEHGHYENKGEHGHYENEGEHGHYENEGEHGHYENEGEHGHYENEGEHGHYENEGEHGHYENEGEHGHYENEGEHGHYENEGEHGHYENEGEHGHYENEEEHGHYKNEGEHGHYEEHKYYQYDKNHAHDENDKEHAHYENDEEHAHYANDEEHSNLSTHVYADLDPDFLAAQDAIKNATAQPFYEMDITPADEEQEQPFYKMDAIAAKDKQQEEQPFYEINVASTDGNNEEVFYKMDGDKLGQPTPSENAYGDLDPDFVAAQDSVDRRHGGKEPSRGADSDGTSCSQSCPAFCRFRLGRMVALCVGVIIVGIAATMVAVILNQHSVLRVHPNIVLDHTLLPTTSTTVPTQLSVTTQDTSGTTVETDWWGEWTLYIRAYFQQNRDTAAGLEERYPDNEVVMVLLEDRFFWPFVCRYWKIYNDLPHTLDKAVSFGIGYGITSDYMESHGLSAYSEVFSSMLNALETLRNKTDGLSKNGNAKLLLLQVLNIAKNSITNVGGKAVANRLVHLQQLRKLYLGENELALSVSALAKAFANMTRLEYVSMAPITCYCNSTSLRMAAQQVRDAVHTLAGQLTDRRGFRLYGGSRNKDSMQGLHTAWQRVENELTSGLGITISNRQLKSDWNLAEELLPGTAYLPQLE
ncbi:hypothetical protein Bbelb_377880 [Branchiostoma belcheri]|nr:hypothetical protein Bbelb_377880 [Branchiostoma belcheri]